MADEQKNESGYRIANILLVESNFSRSAIVAFNDTTAKNNLDINATSTVNGNVVNVEVFLHYNFSKGSENQVDAKIKMIGAFERMGEPKLSAEEFGKINGPAIIYPFIREHLSSLSLKAGLGNLLIPPVNFSKA